MLIQISGYFPLRVILIANIKYGREDPKWTLFVTIVMVVGRDSSCGNATSKMRIVNNCVSFKIFINRRCDEL